MNIKQWFCSHKWIKISEVMMNSAFEQTASTGEYTIDKDLGTPAWIFQKKFIITMMCDKCKKLKQFVELNP